MLDLEPPKPPKYLGQPQPPIIPEPQPLPLPLPPIIPDPPPIIPHPPPVEFTYSGYIGNSGTRGTGCEEVIKAPKGILFLN
jgi:hypothetical protein